MGRYCLSTVKHSVTLESSLKYATVHIDTLWIQASRGCIHIVRVASGL